VPGLVPLAFHRFDVFSSEMAELVQVVGVDIGREIGRDEAIDATTCCNVVSPAGIVNASFVHTFELSSCVSYA
jgi:hypothetical protein